MIRANFKEKFRDFAVKKTENQFLSLHFSHVIQLQQVWLASNDQTRKGQK